MTDIQIIVLLKLLTSHILADFFFQPYGWVKSKQTDKIQSVPLYLHCLTAGALAGIFTQNIWVGIGIFAVHLATDIWKVYQKNQSTNVFLIDQILHLLALLVAWILLTHNSEALFITAKEQLEKPRVWGIALAYGICTFPLGISIGQMTTRFRQQIKNPGNTLQAAGKWIGITERILILTFLFNNQLEAIGFLIAAKALLRFNDEDLKLTEYVLVGTLLSFTITILIGIAVHQIK
jgi:hypothetical protein